MFSEAPFPPLVRQPDFRSRLVNMLIFVTTFSGCSLQSKGNETHSLKFPKIEAKNLPLPSEPLKTASIILSDEEQNQIESKKLALKEVIESEMVRELDQCRSELKTILLQRLDRYEIQARWGNLYDELTLRFQDGLQLTEEETNLLNRLNVVFEGVNYEVWVENCVALEVEKRCNEYSEKLKAIEQWLKTGLTLSIRPMAHYGSLGRQVAESIFDSRPQEFIDLYPAIQTPEELEYFFQDIMAK